MAKYKKPPGKRTAKTKQAFRLIVDTDASTGALDTTPSVGAAPTSNVRGCANFQKARLIFGVRLGTEDDTVNYQITLWYPLRIMGTAPKYCPVVVAHGVYTLGTTVIQYPAVGGGFYEIAIADTITDDTAWDGLVKQSPADNNIAMLEIELRGASHITVDTQVSTGAANVYAQLGE